MSQFSIDEISRSPDTKPRLTLFKAEDVQWLETQISEKNGKPYLVHTIAWVAQGQITANGLPEHAREFAQNNIYALEHLQKVSRRKLRSRGLGLLGDWEKVKEVNGGISS